MTAQREFQFTDRDFRCLQRLVLRHTGITLSPAKRDMLYSRLARRLRALGLRRFKEYCALLQEDGDSEELRHFTNAVTTNLTAFFREPHHFDYLRDEFLPAMIERRADQRRLRIWSAGCSTGEEPYSIAITLAETMPRDWDVRILATDLDSNVLDRARQGIYSEERTAEVPERLKRKWFLRGRAGHQGKVRVRRELRDVISFRQLNLMYEWPMRGPFDAIFCRNVIIYFDKPTQSRLMDRFADILADDGRLFLGHSETLYRVTDRFQLLGRTIYRKVT